MKKKIFLLLFCVLIAFSVSVGMASAKTWHVDDDFVEYPAADFSSIQDAIDAADLGDIVYVYNGTYYESLVINKQLELTGAGKETIIHGGWYDTCVKIMSPSVSIAGFRIEYSGSDGAGIYVSSNNNIITNNTLIENGYGIELIKDSNTIMNNVITNNTKDVYLKGDLNNIISNIIRDITIESADYNKIANNYVTGGIDLESSDHNNIVNNTIKADINLEMSTYNNIVNNRIKMGITLDARLTKRQKSNHNTIANNTVKYISLKGSNHNKIINNIISQSNEDGISIKHGNYCRDVRHGLYLNWECDRVYSEFNEISNNIINSSNRKGIYLGEKSNNTKIINNSINSNKGCGIYLHASNYCDITNNSINSNQKEGIYLYQSSNNNLTNNEMNSNKDGTYLTEESGKNQITNNSIKDNEYGIYLSSGSSHNKIYHNNFINNTAQAEEHKSINRFDNGPKIGGNYWSDHECEGNPSNGTQPYLIPIQNNHDKYPFENENGWL
jgi:parallel beta-helix repeat protein